MCRQLIAVGNLSELPPAVLEAFAKASACDPLMPSVAGTGKCGRHGDGWGFAAATLEEYQRVEHYRSTIPVYEDAWGFEKLRRALRGEGVLVVHARKASAGSVSARNTHPIHYGWRGYEMFLAHNGSMRAGDLAASLGVPVLPDVTDTFYLGEYVYRRLDLPGARNLAEAFGEAARYTETAMNVAAMLWGSSLLGVAISYLSPGLLGSEVHERYYRLLLLRGDGWVAVFSSTLAEYLGGEGFEELPFQSGLALSVERGGGVRVRAFRVG